MALRKPGVIALFDVDGTLTAPRKTAAPEMLEFMKELRKIVTIGVVSGSDLIKISEQLGKSVINDYDYVFSENGLVAHKDGKLIGTQSLKSFLGEEKLKVAQATSNQMSKRDPLRPYMDVIDNMLAQMFREDPSFKPQGGRLGENDMDSDSDEKSMATLRRHLRLAREEYYRYKSEYMTYVSERFSLKIQLKIMNVVVQPDGNMYQVSDLIALARPEHF